MTSPPPRRPLSVIRSAIVDAQLAGNATALEQLFLEGVALTTAQAKEPIEFLLPLARLRQELGLLGTALNAWREIFSATPTFEAAYHLLNAKRAGQDPFLDQRIEKVLDAPALLAIERVIERGVTAATMDARHLGIFGVSYCGSTMVGRMLDSLEGFHDIAESHWLINRKTPQNGNRQIDFLTGGALGDIFHCRQCDEDCAVLTKDFRLEMQLDRTAWYFRIATRLNTPVLVSSDKNFRKYIELDPLLRFDVLVLFKSPFDAWQSFRKRRSFETLDQEMSALETVIESWLRDYRHSLSMIPKGAKLFLFFDRFLKAPQTVMARLLEQLDLSPRTLDLKKTMEGRHAIGGNEGFVSTTRQTGRIELRRRGALDLPPRHIQAIASRGEVSDLFRELRAMSDAQFGA